MANFSLPTVNSLYTVVLDELNGKIADCARMLDPATSTPTNQPVNSIRWNSASSKFEKWNGTAWADLATTYAIAITGNAGTVTNGVYLVGNQTIAGVKTFSSPISGSVTGNAGSVTNGVYTTGDQSIAGLKTFTGATTTVTSVLQILRQDASTEGGELRLARASDNAGGWYIDVFGTGTTPSLRFINNNVVAVAAQIDSNNNLIVAGNVTAFSDARLKTDLVKISNALDKIETLTGYTYTRIDTGERQTGLLAQDVQKILPEVIVDAEHLSIAYGNLMGLIVEGIKELRQEVAALKAQLV